MTFCRYELSGKTFQSRVARTPAHRYLLDEVGEIAFYLSQNRTALIVADEPGTLYRLLLHDLQRMALPCAMQ